ncbi:platelet basic protein-like [Ochotona curzoniae]|uniref:platelet basic protein-like n=1 Tax=Ochotona curzoniae TaxID=130825 RepID=UPI001B350CDE|nr:platelet basic protein-like [Ochotona curzoniae]
MLIFVLTEVAIEKGIVHEVTQIATCNFIQCGNYLGWAHLTMFLWYSELCCTCGRTTSGIHLCSISKLEMISPGAHCAKMELIATTKDGKKICLDTEAPRIKRIIQKMLAREGSAD